MHRRSVLRAEIAHITQRCNIVPGIAVLSEAVSRLAEVLCKLLKRAVSGDNGWDDGTDLGTGSLQRVFEKLTLPLRSRAHLRDYGSHEHPMLRHRSQRRRLGLDRPIPAARSGGRPRTTDLRAVLNAIFYLLRKPVASGACYPASSRARAPFTYFRAWKEAAVL